jgi:hypothetical protein
MAGMSLNEYKSLKGVAEWEIAVANLGISDFVSSASYWRTLEKESNWSKVGYILFSRITAFDGNCRRYTLTV